MALASGVAADVTVVALAVGGAAIESPEGDDQDTPCHCQLL